MPDNLKQEANVCSPIVDAVQRQFSEYGLSRVHANFDFVKEFIDDRIHNKKCYSRVVDIWSAAEKKDISKTAGDMLFAEHPDAKGKVKNGFTSAAVLLEQLDRNHDSEISLKEVINRGVELAQINKSGTGDKKTHNEMAALGPVFGYLKNKEHFNPRSLSHNSKSVDCSFN